MCLLDVQLKITSYIFSGEWETKKKCFNEYILHFIYHFVLYANYVKEPTAGKGAIYPCKLAILESAGGYIYFDAKQKG